MRDAILSFPNRATAGAAYEAAGLPASTLVQYPPVRNPIQPDEEAPDAWLPNPDQNWYAAWRGEVLPAALAQYEANVADPPIRIAGDIPQPRPDWFSANAGEARRERAQAKMQRQAQRLAARGKTLEALKLLNNL